MAASVFECHRRLHVDHRQAVREDVVQFPCDGQPHLRGPSLLLGLSLAGHRCLALPAGIDDGAALPDPLGDRDEHDQPRRDRTDGDRGRGILAAKERDQPDHRRPAQ